MIHRLDKIVLVKKKKESNIYLQEHEQTKELLDEIVERLKEIELRKQKNERSQRRTTDFENGTTTSTTVNEQETRPPPDDYRLLPIIPSVTEILSEERTYLRRNIVDGVYESPEHYLDVNYLLSLLLFIFYINFRFIFVFYEKISLVHYVKVFNNIYPVNKEKISM